MSDEQAGHIQVVVEADQPLAKFLPHLGVYGPERFVQQQDTGLRREGSGNSHSLTLTA